MIDEILAREEILRHGSFGDILEPEVTVDISHRGHDRLTRQVNTQRARWYLQLPPPADASELAILDNKFGVLDGSAAVARDEPCPFKRCHLSRPSLATHLPRPCRHQEQASQDENIRRSPNHALHKNPLRNGRRESVTRVHYARTKAEVNARQRTRFGQGI